MTSRHGRLNYRHLSCTILDFDYAPTTRLRPCFGSAGIERPSAKLGPMEKTITPRFAQQQAVSLVTVEGFARSTTCCSGRATFLCAIGAVSALCGSWASAESAPELELAAASSLLDQITVTAKRVELLGTADTASVGVWLTRNPAYARLSSRPVSETVPGLIVTLHSGEGKANQFLLRGYNLITGRILRLLSTICHQSADPCACQGYTDLNFMIPELADEITYTKGRTTRPWATSAR